MVELLKSYETHIQFNLPKDSRVKLEVFEVTGKLVATLVDGPMPAGRHVVDFNARQLSSGLYFYRIHANQYTAVKKMLLMKSKRRVLLVL